MFDSIMLNVKCPYCEKEEIHECQTKDMDCILVRYHKGDLVPTDYHDLDCIASCNEMQSKFFSLDVFVKDGRITGEYEIYSTTQFG